MLKRYCDRCGNECVNTHARLRLSEESLTSQGEHLEEEDYQPIDLCHTCCEVLKGTFLKGVKVVRHRSEIYRDIDPPPLVGFDEEVAVNSPLGAHP